MIDDEQRGMTQDEKESHKIVVEFFKNIKDARTLLLILVWQMWLLIAVAILIFLALRHGFNVYTNPK